MMDDIDRIMAVMERAFDPYWGEAWTRRQVESSLMMASTHYRLAGEDGHPPVDTATACGFAMVKAAPGEEEVLLIATLPEVRGRGVGGHLIEALVEDARARGAEQLFLEMRENNPAGSLYSRHGFVAIGRRKNYYSLADGTRLDAITYARKL